jgi:hypothetical protein
MLYYNYRSGSRMVLNEGLYRRCIGRQAELQKQIGHGMDRALHLVFLSPESHFSALAGMAPYPFGGAGFARMAKKEWSPGFW